MIGRFVDVLPGARDAAISLNERFFVSGTKKNMKIIEAIRIPQKMAYVYSPIDFCNRKWVKSGNFGQLVKSDIHLQTVKNQMRRLLMSHLIRIFTVCLVNLLFIPMIQK